MSRLQSSLNGFYKAKIHTALNPYIDSILIENPNKQIQNFAYKVIPSSALVMGFQYRGRLSILKNSTPYLLNKSGITGLQTTYRIFQGTHDTRSILIKFKPWGSAAFFNEPMYLFSNTSLALNDIVKDNLISNIEEQLSAADGNYIELERIIEEFLLQLLLKHNLNQPKKILIALIQEIYAYSGTKKIQEIAKKFGFTERNLERCFKSIVGLSPKQFSNLVRFESTLSILNNSKYSLEALGFFDQSHLIHNFKKFSGVTPNEFIRNLTF